MKGNSEMTIQGLSQLDFSLVNKVQEPDILVVSRVFPPDPGGIQDYTYNRCLQDPSRVIVLTAAHPGDRVFDQAQPFPVYRWPVPQFLHDFFRRSGLLGGVLKQLLYLIESFALAIQLYRRYRYRYIEWLHGYDFPTLLLLSYLLPVRFFIYLHGDDLLCPLRNSVVRALFEWTIRRAEGVVCNSSFTSDYLKAHFQLHTPIHIINPSLRLEKFGDQEILDRVNTLRTEVRRAHKIPEQAVAILSVGRLVRRKGFDRVIENLPALLAEGIDVYYFICGRGSMEPELKSLVSRLGVEKRVFFAGYVPDNQLASYYAACDLFAMLTFFDAEAKSIEGFGIVYLEAGYFAKPVIASRLGGVVDAVHHGESGLLVNPNSATEIAHSLLQLCKDQQLRKRLGRRGQELAERKTLHRLLYSDQISEGLCESNQRNKDR
jgi:phosphatidylinositol alpha-1,6-mannosyltransferase